MWTIYKLNCSTPGCEEKVERRRRIKKVFCPKCTRKKKSENMIKWMKLKRYPILKTKAQKMNYHLEEVKEEVIHTSTELSTG